jgi:uncharacterized RDD family membrane protein YckC
MRSSPSITRCLASFLYEGILLFAILFVAGIVYRALFGDPQTDTQRHLFFIYSWLIVGVYFVYCWVKSGQTLAMKTWRIQLVNRYGSKVDWVQAINRYILASFSLMFFGLGFVWRLFDREALFLHDRLTGCQLVVTQKHH